MEPWLRRPPKPAKSLIVILMAVIATMAMMAFGVWLWAINLPARIPFTPASAILRLTSALGVRLFCHLQKGNVSECLTD